ncbi:MAG: DUF4955 domain-containing protein, partial [bacterium]
GLEINSSNIVIRGAGSGYDGTTLTCFRPSDSPNPAQMWRANEYPVFFHAGHTSAPQMGGYGPRPTARLTGVMPASRHALRLRVEQPAALSVGTTYLLTQLEDADGSLGLALVFPGTKIGENYQGAGKPLVTQYVTVLGIEGDEIVIDTPLHWDTRPEWRPALYAVPLLREVGIEGLRLQSTWEEYFEHHKNAKHDDGYDHIRFDGIENGWVRDVVHDSPTSAVTLMGTKHCTVMDGAVIGNPGHNAYAAVAACTANLFYRLDGNRAMHTFGLQGTPCGTVYLDCHANEPAGIDMHGGVGLDNLYDNLIGCVNVGGGAASAVPPRNSHGLVLWNWQQGRYNPYRAWRTAIEITKWDETPGFMAIGVRGRDGHRVCYTSPAGTTWDNADAPWGYVESINQQVAPRSLYRYQMQRRMGCLPGWL